MAETSRLLGVTTTNLVPGYGSLDPEAANIFIDPAEIFSQHDHILPDYQDLPKDVAQTPVKKLGTMTGVFVPTTLNVLSILMFLRFGFIIGQAGCLGMLGMLMVCYLVNLLTTLSLSAIATNGTVRGGGAYYLISRSLGPEFGGSIGLVFYIGSALNTGMNAVGMIDCLVSAFGEQEGSLGQWLPQGVLPQYIAGTLVLLVCTVICMAGSGIFARASNGLLVVLLVATMSIPISAMFATPFVNPALKTEFSRPNWTTLSNNFFPRFTEGAAGSGIKGKENWQDLFGILFPATSGIFAGASMSGDLQHPSKAIPKGTLYGLGLTFCIYSLVIISISSSVTRETLYHNLNVLADINLSPTIILCGELASSFFSALMGLIGASKVLQALARDDIVPGLRVFARGFGKTDEPIIAIVLSYVIAQATLLSDINQIAALATMAYLMTFLVTNLACFLLKISSAPNFRPSFRWFNLQTAGIGALASAITMGFVDGLYASGCVGIIGLIFPIIHYTAPPNEWGDVSQSLIYHQVRKYLLRLKSEHVKFWRPQILLLVNDPWRQHSLIQFCNSLKKGGLYVLGHIIVTSDFGSAVPEVKKQQATWPQYIDFSKIKAFMNINVAPTLEWGVRNAVLGAGLGGMRPNIVMMGFYNLGENQMRAASIHLKGKDIFHPSGEGADGVGSSKLVEPTPKDIAFHQISRLHGTTLPTDSNRTENSLSPKTYVGILEDLLLGLQMDVAIGKGFQGIDVPIILGNDRVSGKEKKWIDLWPIQMMAQISEDSGLRMVSATNFDTYTMILQLGVILSTVPSWKRRHTLRVAVFVEYECDVKDERSRVEDLLARLRIKAKVLVFWLASGDLQTYEMIVNGKGVNDGIDQGVVDAVNYALQGDTWWNEITEERQGGRDGEFGRPYNEDEDAVSITDSPLLPPVHYSMTNSAAANPQTARLMHLKPRRMSNVRTSVSSLRQMDISLSMVTQRLNPELVSQKFSPSQSSDDEDDDEPGVLESNNEVVGSPVQTAFERFLSRANSVSSRRSSGLLPRAIERVGRLSQTVKNWGPKTSSIQFADAIHPRYQTVEPNSEDGASKGLKSAIGDTSLETDSPLPPTVKADKALGGLTDEGRKIPKTQITRSGGSTRRPKAKHSTEADVPFFTSRRVPAAKVNDETEGIGPSIMFAEELADGPDARLSHRHKHEKKPGSTIKGDKKAGGDGSAVGLGPYTGSATQQQPSRPSSSLSWNAGAIVPSQIPSSVVPSGLSSGLSSAVSSQPGSAFHSGIHLADLPQRLSDPPRNDQRVHQGGRPRIPTTLSNTSVPRIGGYTDSISSNGGGSSAGHTMQQRQQYEQPPAAAGPDVAASRASSDISPLDRGFGLDEDESGGDESTHSGSAVTGATSMITRTASIPLSFNDLPSRAQQIILNELIRTNSGDGKQFTFPRATEKQQQAGSEQDRHHHKARPRQWDDDQEYDGADADHSPVDATAAAVDDDDDDPSDSSWYHDGRRTAVVFTTLPCPLINTKESEAKSLCYLVSLEIMCLGLPPVLLVHSNSVSVTVNL